MVLSFKLKTPRVASIYLSPSIKRLSWRRAERWGSVENADPGLGGQLSSCLVSARHLNQFCVLTQVGCNWKPWTRCLRSCCHCLKSLQFYFKSTSGNVTLVSSPIATQSSLFYCCISSILLLPVYIERIFHYLNIYLVSSGYWDLNSGPVMC